MKIKLDTGAFLPVREHDTDAGLDIRSREMKIVPSMGSAVFHTGVHVKIPHGYAGILISKSGLNVIHDITSTGLIDEGYTGEIIVKLVNHGQSSYLVNNGDKISQLVLVPVSYEPVNIVDVIKTETARGENGLGSTGK